MNNIAQTIHSFSENDTEHFAAELAGKLSPGSIVTLQGDLGAGKTVFARGLGITEPVSSPT